MIKISSNMNFSHSIAKGTAKSRESMTEQINDNVFKGVLRIYDKKNTCGIGAIKTHFNMVLPEKKDINIKPLPVKDYDNYGGSTVIEDNNSFLTGYSIEMPVSKKKKLCILELPEFMHESTHVIDWLLNPKYVANYKKMLNKDIFNKKCYDIYPKFFDNADDMFAKSSKKMLKITEEKTKEAIKKLPFEEKMTFLNYIRYRMELENHAYKEEVRFAKQMKKIGKPVDSVSLEDYTAFMKIPQKIKLIKQIISEEISKERNYK